eukprot:scaffold1817_cov95-Isochrysis_galbana.AAC.3
MTHDHVNMGCGRRESPDDPGGEKLLLGYERTRAELSAYSLQCAAYKLTLGRWTRSLSPAPHRTARPPAPGSAPRPSKMHWALG